jgi:hypothetical protein
LIGSRRKQLVSKIEKTRLETAQVENDCCLRTAFEFRLRRHQLRASKVYSFGRTSTKSRRRNLESLERISIDFKEESRNNGWLETSADDSNVHYRWQANLKIRSVLPNIDASSESQHVANFKR